MSASEKVIAPRHRRSRVSLKPAESEPGFPLGDFLVTPTDSLGRSVQLTVVVPPIARRAASRMLAKGLFGFETEQDVWRYCITYGLADLALKSEDGEITGDVAILHNWNAFARVEMEQIQYLRGLNVQERMVRAMIQQGHARRALYLAELAWKDHDKVEDSYWRKQFRTRLKRLLDQARTAAGNGDTSGSTSGSGRRNGHANGSGNGNGRHG